MIRRELVSHCKPDKFEDTVGYLIGNIAQIYNIETILGVNFFTDTFSDKDYFEKKTLIKNKFKTVFGNITTGVIAQAPEKGVIAEIWTSDSLSSIHHLEEDGISYTTYKHDFGKSLFALDLSAEASQTLTLTEQSDAAFKQMEKILSKEHFKMSEVIRQWNYIPNILCETIQEEEGLQQNYQIFNDKREFFYSKNNLTSHFPAATGIGIKNGYVTIDFLALQPNEKTIEADLANPFQINAFDYSQQQLVGSQKTKKTPLFVRAKTIANESKCEIMVSGTASILGEQTHGVGQTDIQTQTTIDNINQLISSSNLSKHININQKTNEIKYSRIYVKDLKDIHMVKNIYLQTNPSTTALYVQADVCRCNLLVEIESDVFVNYTDKDNSH